MRGNHAPRVFCVCAGEGPADPSLSGSACASPRTREDSAAMRAADGPADPATAPGALGVAAAATPGVAGPGAAAPTAPGASGAADATRVLGVSATTGEPGAASAVSAPGWSTTRGAERRSSSASTACTSRDVDRGSTTAGPATPPGVIDSSLESDARRAGMDAVGRGSAKVGVSAVRLVSRDPAVPGCAPGLLGGRGSTPRPCPTESSGSAGGAGDFGSGRNSPSSMCSRGIRVAVHPGHTWPLLSLKSARTGQNCSDRARSTG